MLGRLDELNPAFAEARAAYAGPSASMNAMEIGRRLLRDGADAAEVSAREIARLSPSEREFFRTGVARGLMDRIGAATDGAEQTRLNRIFMQPQVRERLRAAFDSDAEFAQFANNLRAEANMAATNRAVAPNGGSPTAPMQERLADLRNPPRGPVQAASSAYGQSLQEPLADAMLSAWRTGGITAPGAMLLQRGREWGREARFQRNTDAMAPILFSSDPAVRQRMAEALAARAAQDTNPGVAWAPSIQAGERLGVIEERTRRAAVARALQQGQQQ
jgi:hypothetical protein